MVLHPHGIKPIPSLTKEIAQKAFPKGNQYIIPLAKNNYTTASINGTTLKLSYCPIDKAISLTAWLRYAYLKEQYAVGNVEVKTV